MKTRKFYVTLGLPASGKSSWANQFLKDDKNKNIININRDDLRNMLFGNHYKHSRHREKMVTLMQMAIANEGFDNKKDIIISDTNLNPTTYNRLCDWALEHKYEVIKKDFTDISREECIKRDLVRVNSVGSKVINRMYDKYIKEAPKKYKGNDKQDTVIVDIDGTIAKMVNRSPYDWALVGQDTVHEDVKLLVDGLYDSGKKIIYLSGRDGVCYDDTLNWLRVNEFPDHDNLFMRAAGNCEKDSIIKEDIFWEHIASQNNVIMCIDDRDSVVSLWRSLGIRCVQVAPGDF
jgi:predicted kinase